MSTHLWDVKHKYYCSSTNYYNNDTAVEFDSIADFLADMEDADFDMNLLFRWDWIEDDDEAPSFNGDINYRNGKLWLFWMGQRKGLYWAQVVSVCRADEDAVRAFLRPRLAHLLSLWSPMMEEQG